MLEIENLSVKYKTSNEWNLRNVSLKLKKGQLVIFAGRSGSGKSTLAQAILGLIPKFIPATIEGKIKVNEMDSEKLSRADLIKTIGYIPQYPSDFITNMVVEEEVAFPLENHSFPPERIKERVFDVMERTEILHLSKRIMTELSSGEIQRVELASSLATFPEILVLDEPLARIDPASEEKIAKTLHELAKKGHLVLVFEHRLDHLFSLADRIFFLEKGKIVKEGVPHKIIDELSGVDLPEIYLLNNLCNVNGNINDKEQQKKIVTLLNGLNQDYQKYRQLLKIENSEKEKSILSIKNLHFSYDTRLVLENINVEIRAGKVIGLLGKNGTGKSTFLRILTGILKTNKGEITLFNKRIKRLRQASKYFAYVPENAKLFLMGPTPLDDIKRTKANIKQVKEELQEYGYWELVSRKLYHMSEGERRILAIYTAFLSEKEIILLDEPTIGLDEKGRSLLNSCIQQAREKGKAVIIATNDQRILPFFEEIIVIEENKIKLHGNPQEILYSLEEQTQLIPNQLVRYIRKLEKEFNVDLPHIISIKEFSELLKKEKKSEVE